MSDCRFISRVRKTSTGALILSLGMPAGHSNGKCRRIPQPYSSCLQRSCGIDKAENLLGAGSFRSGHPWRQGPRHDPFFAEQAPTSLGADV